MTFLNNRSLAAKIMVLVALSGSPVTQTTYAAGIPVVDLTNLTQNIMTAMESVAQTLKQIEQYKTQLQQYENMLQNTMAPAAWIWDQANNTINDLMRSVDTLNYYKQQVGSIDKYLDQYQDVTWYRNSPCFKGKSCSPQQMQAIRDTIAASSEAQKRSNDAMLRGVDQQQISLQNDARQLVNLQQQAQGATGQMAAMQYANQLASSQTNQLLQIRGLLLAQQTATATRAAAVNAKESIETAGAESFRAGSLDKSPVKKW
ncbi:TPA: P-type conjugative transfer protein TrbJ [Yersinia enterocolitica]|uniref:P-type conjugative transfer protein TrbJ n=1 Tax=Yersinia enterocolitica TaxID=630 RepID=UPI0029B59AAB|nr:P-type conjugative transfer protein TrbJ [Yersinia enterocolitica]EKN5104263.1 P-type conjugative transfer protein TrbJ [Yersinia enterocolitica]EKN6091033.1 P-type conjugative transfer protein TrbJ [Yersinia enterocolitica]ELX2238791.1 P-type conjugative transfer protein TrbJ [Yersinia enterocolitica]ELY5241996.1 P-type conjugative transfer protein TrbJ [Yersinia enterocolitica]